MPDEQAITDDGGKLECDLVMKGGITSGIVYPPLVIKLHQRGYRFRNIGGTSAGAIAAAVAAAAEHGRESGGFEKLNDVREWLGKDGNLRNLFQPSRETAPLMNTLFGYSDLKSLRWPPLRVLVSLVLHDFWAFVGGGLLGVAFSLILLRLFGGTVEGMTHATSLILFARLLALALSALAGAVALCAWHLYQIVKNVLPDARFGFGLCTGRGPDLRKLDETVLTDWLSARINDIAGKDVEGAPLTFGELWEPLDEGGRRRIDLRMMTSDLSQNQPYVLPFEDELFIFDEREMLRFFPPAVVSHMVARARPLEGLRPPYHLLPEAKDLPVIFATRLSLSFPVLISAVPLYTLSPKALGEAAPPVTDPEKDLQRNWFSDGGICSNFPIHFFDAWLPSRPTFGVSLTSQLAEGTPDDPSKKADLVMGRSSLVSLAAAHETEAPRAAFAKDVYLPKANEILPPQWIPIRGVGKFFETIFTTAQNYRDNMQAMLPSYRERIVQIRLTDEEGGLNLNMDPATIRKVVAKGGEAGDALIHDFRMDQHQWVRFRVLTKQLEKNLYDFKEAMAPGSFYDTTLKTRPLNPTFPYQRDGGWLNNAETRLDEMRRLIGEIQRMNPEFLFSAEAPRPDPVLRVTPQI
jgi:predicted acylesterase/phospholipase RssA